MPEHPNRECAKIKAFVGQARCKSCNVLGIRITDINTIKIVDDTVVISIYEFQVAGFCIRLDFFYSTCFRIGIGISICFGLGLKNPISTLPPKIADRLTYGQPGNTS